jgi:hypothetical protein
VSEKTKFPKGVTAEMVKEWEAKCKNGIARVDCGGFAAYLRRPERNDMRELSTKMQVSDPVTYAECILDTLWLGGDEEIRKTDRIFFGVGPAVMDILDAEVATLKKL